MKISVSDLLSNYSLDSLTIQSSDSIQFFTSFKNCASRNVKAKLGLSLRYNIVHVHKKLLTLVLGSVCVQSASGRLKLRVS